MDIVSFCFHIKSIKLSLTWHRCNVVRRANTVSSFNKIVIGHKLRWCKLYLIVYRSFNQTFFLYWDNAAIYWDCAVRCAMHWMKHINYTFILRIATINLPTQFHSIVSYFSFFFNENHRKLLLLHLQWFVGTFEQFLEHS